MLFLFIGGGKTKDQKFGIEIELTGLSRAKAAEIIAKYFGTESYHVGGAYDPYTVIDDQNRKWKVVRDGSIRCTDRNGNSENGEYSVEFVSPICVYDDIETIQQLVRNLRAGGAVANFSCGIHIHINGAPYDAKSLRNLTNIMNSKENLIYKALKVNVSREHRYCQKVDQNFLEELNRRKPKNIDAVQNIWYGGMDGSHVHYHESRYHCLNLHSLFSKGMNGIYENAVLKALESHSNISEIYLCTDNDVGGIDAAYRLRDILNEKGYTKIGRVISENKDWNEDLKALYGIKPIPAVPHIRREKYLSFADDLEFSHVQINRIPHLPSAEKNYLSAAKILLSASAILISRTQNIPAEEMFERLKATPYNTPKQKELCAEKRITA